MWMGSISSFIFKDLWWGKFLTLTSPQMTQAFKLDLPLIPPPLSRLKFYNFLYEDGRKIYYVEPIEQIFCSGDKTY